LKKYFRRIFVTLITGLLLLVGILLLAIIFYFTGYLSRSNKVEANLLVVEGWMSNDDIKSAYSEFKNNGYVLIITTGLHSPEYLQMSENGFAVFDVKGKLTSFKSESHHRIDVKAYSETDRKQSSHFNVYLNDSLIGGYYADKKRRNYRIYWDGSLDRVDSIMLQFDNDLVGEFGDRNLYIKEILIDNFLHIPFQLNSKYIIPRKDGIQIIRNNYNSLAQRAKYELLSLGLDSSKVISVPGRESSVNKTLNSAFAFRDWLKHYNGEVIGINIMSQGIHARRTFITYKKVLDNSYKVGIISQPDLKSNNSFDQILIKPFKETIGIIFYWIILTPYGAFK
jgi:hypothetical protein